MNAKTMQQTMTTPQIVRKFSNAGRLDDLRAQMESLPKGERISFEKCLNPRFVESPAINDCEAERINIDIDDSDFFSVVIEEDLSLH